jgi:hypothetical protein
MRAPADLLAVWRTTLGATRVNGHYRYDPMHRHRIVLAAGRLQTLLRYKAQPKKMHLGQAPQSNRSTTLYPAHVSPS